MVQVFSPASLKKIIEHLFPKELIPSDWLCTEEDALLNIQSLLDHSPDNSAIHSYGTAKDIYAQLKTSVAVPGFRRNLLSLPDTEGFADAARYFFNLKNQIYIYKHDIFKVIQNTYLSMQAPLTEMENKLSRYLVTLCIRTIENALSKNNEMIELRDGDLEALKLCLSHYGNAFNEVLKMKTKEIASSTWRIVFKVDDDKQTILNSFTDRYQIKEDPKFFTRVFTWAGLMKTAILAFLKLHPANFKPNHELTPQQQSLCVRIFKDGNDKYLMIHELFQVLKTGGLDTSEVEKEIKTMKRLGAIDFRQAYRLIGSNVSKLEFVTVPITVTKRGTTLLPSYNGEGYCLPASDVFMELVTNLWLVKKVAQRFDWPYIAEFFETISEYFECSEVQGRYFIDLEDIKKINQLRDAHFSSDGKSAIEPRRYPNGFSAEDLQNECKYLNLDRVFEDITDVAEQIYNDIFYRYNLHEADIFTAIEACHMKCFTRRLPQFTQFIHNQKACTTYNVFQCDICKNQEEVQQTSEEVEEVVEKETTSEEDFSADLEVTTTSDSSTPSVADSEQSQGTVVTSEVEDSEVEATTLSEEHSTLIHEATRSDSTIKPVIEKNQKKKKKSKKTKKALVEIQNEKKPEEKESQCCQKCFRTSEICRKAQEDAKASKNKIKKLEKDLKNSEKESKKELLEVKREAENEKQRMREDFEIQMKKVQEENEMLKRLLAASKTEPEESKEPEGPEEEELCDLECLICHDDMDDIKDTLKCQNCCRRYHKDCLVGWFEKSRSCPVCDSEFEEGIES